MLCLGESRPVANNSILEGRQQDRRVEGVGRSEGDEYAMSGKSARILLAAAALAPACGAPDAAGVDGQAPGAARAASPAAVHLATLTIGDTTYEFRILRCDLTGSAEDGILLRGNGTAPDGRRFTVEVERLAPPIDAGTIAERVTLNLLPDGDRDAAQWEARRETSMFDRARWIRSYADAEPADGPLFRISGTELVAADTYAHSLLLTPQRQRQFTPAERRKFLNDARETKAGTLRATCPVPGTKATP